MLSKLDFLNRLDSFERMILLFASCELKQEHYIEVSPLFIVVGPTVSNVVIVKIGLVCNSHVGSN